MHKHGFSLDYTSYPTRIPETTTEMISKTSKACFLGSSFCSYRLLLNFMNLQINPLETTVCPRSQTVISKETFLQDFLVILKLSLQND